MLGLLVFGHLLLVVLLLLLVRVKLAFKNIKRKNKGGTDIKRE